MQTWLGECIGAYSRRSHSRRRVCVLFFPPVSLRYNWCTAGWALWTSAPVWLTPVSGKFHVPRCLKRILSWCQHLTPCSPPDPPFSPVTTCWDPLHKVLRAFLPCQRDCTHKNLLFLQCLKATVMNTHFLEHSGFFGTCWGGSVCLPTDCPLVRRLHRFLGVSTLLLAWAHCVSSLSKEA